LIEIGLEFHSIQPLELVIHPQLTHANCLQILLDFFVDSDYVLSGEVAVNIESRFL